MTKSAASLISGLVLVLAGSGAAVASEPVATASGTEAPPVSTADQIDRFIRTSPVPDLPKDGAAGVTTSEPRDRSGLRAVHGFVDVGVGTGGYRSVYGLAQMPLGENGSLTVAAGETRGRGYLGYGLYGGDWRSRTLGASLAVGPGAQAAGDPPCARGLDTMNLEMEPRRTWGPGHPPPACRSVP